MFRFITRAVFACSLLFASTVLGADVPPLPVIHPDEVETLTLEQLQGRVAKGDLKAQAELGARYGRGAGVSPDLAKAISLIEKAAAKGGANAQYYLGAAYATGSGVELNWKRAAEWYQKAAAQSHAGGQFELGLIVSYGKGGYKADPAAGMRHILKSAAQGYFPAALRMGELFQSGDGVALDYDKAAYWYRRILKTGSYTPAAARLLILIEQKHVKWQPGDPGAPPDEAPK